jgi:D-glycero-beta-D-manno-heptose-7-phosphate kinase
VTRRFQGVASVTEDVLRKESPKSAEPIDLRHLHQAIPALSGKKVLIIGDVMLDQYLFGAVERISPEAPVPVVQVEREEFRLGGASNVARNIVALGGQCLLMGFLGDDVAGTRMKRLLDEHGIENLCCVEPSRPTTTKTRIIAQQQQVVRIDRESSKHPESDSRAAMLRMIAQEAGSCAVIIISDYGKGLVTKDFVSRIRDIGKTQKRKPFLLVDPKPKNFEAYQGVDLLTPNAKEAGIEAGMESSLEDVARIGQSLRARLQSRQLLITLGPKGMMLLESPDTALHIPTAARKVYDVTGAGDTVIAVLGLALAAGLTTLEGCLLANFAAGLVVGQVGAAVVDQRELAEAVQTWASLGVQDISPCEESAQPPVKDSRTI